MTAFEKYRRNAFIKIFVIPLITAVIAGTLFIVSLPQIKSSLPDCQSYSQQQSDGEADNI